MEGLRIGVKVLKESVPELFQQGTKGYKRTIK